MSLRPRSGSHVPEETARVAQAAFPKGNSYLTLRDELETIYAELVARFHKCQHGSPGPSWRPKAVAWGNAVRKMRGMPRQRRGWNSHDHCLFCSCAPEVDWLHTHAFSHHTSIG